MALEYHFAKIKRSRCIKSSQFLTKSYRPKNKQQKTIRKCENIENKALDKLSRMSDLKHFAWINFRE